MTTLKHEYDMVKPGLNLIPHDPTLSSYIFVLTEYKDRLLVFELFRHRDYHHRLGDRHERHVRLCDFAAALPWT